MLYFSSHPYWGVGSAIHISVCCSSCMFVLVCYKKISPQNTAILEKETVFQYQWVREFVSQLHFFADSKDLNKFVTRMRRYYDRNLHLEMCHFNFIVFLACSHCSSSHPTRPFWESLACGPPVIYFQRIISCSCLV